MIQDADALYLGLYTKREWQAAGMLFVSYLAVYLKYDSFRTSFHQSLIPRTGSRSALFFFGGLRLWPSYMLPHSSEVFSPAYRRRIS